MDPIERQGAGLGQRHYVRRATAANFWFDFAAGRVKSFRSKFGEGFCVIIHGATASYVIPIAELHGVFTPATLDKKNRWVGYITHDQELRLSNKLGSRNVAPFVVSHDAGEIELASLRKLLEGAHQATQSSPPTSSPVEENDILIEGAMDRIWASRVERNSQARRRCIAHYGAKCAACGLSLGSLYGAIAEGYIHVHHLNPLGSPAVEREVDPISDLRPLCPNCHAVAHLRTPPYSPSEIGALIALARGGA